MCMYLCVHARLYFCHIVYIKCPPPTPTQQERNPLSDSEGFGTLHPDCIAGVLPPPVWTHGSPSPQQPSGPLCSTPIGVRLSALLSVLYTHVVTPSRACLPSCLCPGSGPLIRFDGSFQATALPWS